MKFQIGDKILLKRTNEEGSVVAILSPVMMEVEVRGIHFPVYTDEVDHPYLKWFTEKKKKTVRATNPDIPVERIKERPVRLSRGIYLAFAPVYRPNEMEDIVEYFRVSLLNETAAMLHFVYDARRADGSQLFYHKAALHAFGNILLHTVTLEEMNEQPRFNWSFSEEAATLPDTGNKGKLRIKPARLFEQISAIQQSGEPSFSYLLADDAVAAPKVTEVNKPIVPASIPDKLPEVNMATIWRPAEVLDLHIEMLCDDGDAMDAAEILQLQLRHLEYHIEMGIAHHQQQMVIIHGVGNGALKQAVHQYLQTVKDVAEFRNEWMAGYGFGATWVHFS